MANKDMQPTIEMLNAGVKELKLCFPEFRDDADCSYDDDEFQDSVCFIFQAMIAAMKE